MSTQQTRPAPGSATEAAFEGFRITRHNPGAVVLWGVVWLIGLIAAVFATLPFVTPYVQEIVAAQGNPEALSSAAQAAISRAGFAVLPIVFLVQAFVMTAVYRAVLRPSQKAFGYLRVGRDEGRMLIVGIALGAVSLIFNLGGSLLETVTTQAAGMVVAALVSLVLFVVSIVIGVRLSLIAPLSFLRGKLAFAEGWRASGPMFWPLLGVTVLSLTMAVIVVILLVMIGWPLQTAIVGTAGSTSALAVVGSLLMLLLMPLGVALVTTIVWAPFAALCRASTES